MTMTLIMLRSTSTMLLSQRQTNWKIISVFDRFGAGEPSPRENRDGIRGACAADARIRIGAAVRHRRPAGRARSGARGNRRTATREAGDLPPPPRLGARRQKRVSGRRESFFASCDDFETRFSPASPTSSESLPEPGASADKCT